MKPKLTNPLDELFQVEQPSPPPADYIATTEHELATLQAEAPLAEKDEEDVEIDRKIDAVHDAAMDTFQQQMQYAEIVEPRYAARNAEVAANYLNIALSAVSVRAKVKIDRKKTATFAPFAGRNPNGTVVASREEILRMLAVEAETKEDK
jgi:hypothetical protein